MVKVDLNPENAPSQSWFHKNEGCDPEAHCEGGQSELVEGAKQESEAHEDHDMDVLEEWVQSELGSIRRWGSWEYVFVANSIDDNGSYLGGCQQQGENSVKSTLQHRLVWKARDVGGSMIIHAFGAFYGIGITTILRYPKSLESKNLHESQHSLTVAMVGTLFLWCFWPSFNGALANTQEEIHMSVLNTYFSIIGSVHSKLSVECTFRSVMAAYCTSLLFGNGKVNMGQILNATLAGGVIMGACADMLYDVWVAYLCGFLIGIISTMLFVYIPGFFSRFKIHDVAGVYNLHAVPGLLSGFISAIIRQKYIDNRGWAQAVGTVISIGIGLAGGLIVGVLVKGLTAYENENDYFNDLVNVQFEEHIQAELKQYGHGPAHAEVPHVFPVVAPEHAKPKGPSVKPISEQAPDVVDELLILVIIFDENDPKYRDTERKPLQKAQS